MIVPAALAIVVAAGEWRIEEEEEEAIVERLIVWRRKAIQYTGPGSAQSCRVEVEVEDE